MMIIEHGRLHHRGGFQLAGLMFDAVLSAQPVGPRTLMTTYQYNANGALTATTGEFWRSPRPTMLLAFHLFETQ